MGIGTDSYPFNMLEEMREALICSRIAGKSVFDIDTAGVFSAATVGGAAALGGRISAGSPLGLRLTSFWWICRPQGCSRCTIPCATCCTALPSARSATSMWMASRLSKTAAS